MGSRAVGAFGVISAAILAVALSFVATPLAQESADGYRTFQGSWSVLGRRQTLATESRHAAIVGFSGTITVTGSAGLSRGFRGEAIGFDDGGGMGTGRAVWTDTNGDRLFSAVRGEPLESGRRMLGTFTGGTGRYAGVTGDYALTWQYVVNADDDTVQGRAVDLKGRYRLTEGQR